MIYSMTGFGRGEYSDELRTVTVEIKSVNHRYSDITVKMPRRYQYAEEAIKAVVKNRVSRGKMDISVSVENAIADDTKVTLNEALLMQYYNAMVKIRDILPDIKDDISLTRLANMPEVLHTESNDEDEDAFLSAVTAAAESAVNAFCEMRGVEGEKLAQDILMRNDLIEKTVLEIEQYAPSVEKIYAGKIAERISELLDNKIAIPEDRIVLEAAVFADKANITEELVRLKSHCSQLRRIFADSSAPIGKKIDFLVQEMNRESNTIGSKANDINITNNVLILKAEIEKIREQIQNIE